MSASVVGVDDLLDARLSALAATVRRPRRTEVNLYRKGTDKRPLFDSVPLRDGASREVVVENFEPADLPWRRLFRPERNGFWKPKIQGRRRGGLRVR